MEEAQKEQNHEKVARLTAALEETKRLGAHTLPPRSRATVTAPRRSDAPAASAPARRGVGDTAAPRARAAHAAIARAAALGTHFCGRRRSYMRTLQPAAALRLARR